MKTEEKIASNFELNRIQLGKHDIQLEVGDRFITNGSMFNYKPKAKGANTKVLPYRNYYRHTSISCQKYKKDVLRADNIERVVRRPLSFKTEEEGLAEQAARRAKGEDWTMSWWEEYEIKYVYQVPSLRDFIENPMVMWISTDNGFELRTEEIKVERETENTIFFEHYHPITYRKPFPKSDMKLVMKERHRHASIVFYMDDFHECQDKLMKALTETLNNKAAQAENEFMDALNKIDSFEEFKKTQGYGMDIQ